MSDNDRSTCNFEKQQFQQEIPYIIFTDLESALQPFSQTERDPNLQIGGSYIDEIHINISQWDEW